MGGGLAIRKNGEYSYVLQLDARFLKEKGKKTKDPGLTPGLTGERTVNFYDLFKFKSIMMDGCRFYPHSTAAPLPLLAFLGPWGV